MPLFVVEREFPTPLTKEAVLQIFEDKGWCFRTYGVSRLQTFLSADGRRTICIYKAPDAEAIRQSNAMAEVPFTQFWVGDEITP